MRPFALLTAAAVLATTATASLSSLGFPATIKPGDVFNVTGNLLLSQPRQYLAVFGIAHYDFEWHNFPQIGAPGDRFIASYDLQRKLEPQPLPRALLHSM